MPVIAVVNRKGGSGKSTLAAHLAAWCAHQGYPVMLGDVDRQQSTRSWLRKRSDALPAIAPWTVNQNTLKVPVGISHVILDTPGGLHGLDLARMVMMADIILMPVCGSAFDRESAADCYAELLAMPRVANGRCKVACLGMRVEPRSRPAQMLKEWADALGVPFLGILNESASYVQCLERGMTIFDLPKDRVDVELRQWQSLLQWLLPQVTPPPVAESMRELHVQRIQASTQAMQGLTPMPVRPSPAPMVARATTAPSPARPAAAPPQIPTFVSPPPRTVLSSTVARAPSLQPQRAPAPPMAPATPVPAAATRPPAHAASSVLPRIGQPRVLDRVPAANGALRQGANAPAAANSANSAHLHAVAEDAIPSFLRAVKF